MQIAIGLAGMDSLVGRARQVASAASRPARVRQAQATFDFFFFFSSFGFPQGEVAHRNDGMWPCTARHRAAAPHCHSLVLHAAHVIP